MSDQDIIQGLIDRDNRITEHFFYVKCRPLLTAIMRLVYNHPVEYDEMVNQLYEYLIADDCAKLRQFQYRSTIYQWLKIVATRFFIRNRNEIIEECSKEIPYNHGETEGTIDTVATLCDKMDVERLLQFIDNRRYAETIRALILNDISPECYAENIGVTVDNLYNIKKRAMTALTRIAIKYYSYGR